MDVFEYFLICIVSFLGSGLTLFSGFGLGTILIPVFGLFFPIDLTISLTAIVHFLNNLFKLSLLGRMASRQVVLKFGIPSIIAAFAGAFLLIYITRLAPLAEYAFISKTFFIEPVKLIIGLILIFFALFDILPGLKEFQVERKYLPLGGLLSGFIGGISGNQGALRSAFLIRSGLSKEGFIATGVAIACLTDISRLTVYSKEILLKHNEIDPKVLIAATLSAFAGAYIGNRYIKKVTKDFVKYLVAAMLMIFGLLLGLGIV